MFYSTWIYIRNSIAGYGSILITLAISIWRHVNILSNFDVDFSLYTNFEPHGPAIAAERMNQAHTDLIVRFGSCCLLGVIVGHLLYLYETRKIARWPRWFRLLGLKIVLLVIASLYFGVPVLEHPLISQYLPPRPTEINRTVAIWSFSLAQLIPDIIVCIFILLTTTGSGSKTFIKLMSSRISKIFANTSYAVYLIHLEVIFKFPYMKVENLYWYLLLASIFHIFTSNLLAFLIHVLYEMPINHIVRYSMGRLMNSAAK